MFQREILAGAAGSYVEHMPEGLVDMSSLSVLVYPDTGSQLIGTLMNASLYFDKVYILGHYVTGQQALEHRKFLRDQPLVRAWDEKLTLPMNNWVRGIADYARLYESIRPLVNEGIIEYAWKTQGIEQTVREGMFGFMSQWIEQDPTRSVPAVEESRASLALCSVPQGDELIWQTEFGIFAGPAFGKPTVPVERQTRVSDIFDGDRQVTREAAYFLAMLEFLAYRQRLGSSLLTNFGEHERYLTGLLKEAPGLAESLGLGVQQTEAKLAAEIIRAEIPQVSALTAEGILEIRAKLDDELGAFRAELRNIASTIETNPWESQVAEEVRGVVYSRIEPSLANLRRALGQAQLRFVKHLTCDLTSHIAVAIPFVGSVVSGFALEQAAAVGIAAGIGTALLKTRIDTAEIKRQNAMTFVLEAQQLSAKALSKRKHGRSRHSS